MTAGPRVIGLGNELRGDDGVGLLVARELGRLEPAADVLELSGEPAGLLEALAGADDVVLVDAVASGGRPGAIHRFDASDATLPLLAGASTHDLGLSDAIELARALDLLPARLVVLGIEGRTFELGAPLSPEVARAADDAVAELRGLVGRRPARHAVRRRSVAAPAASATSVAPSTTTTSSSSRASTVPAATRERPS